MSYQKIKLRALDKAIKDIKKEQKPQRGWLRAIRNAVQLSLEEVGRRARMPKQNVSRLEQNESTGKITLETMNRLADAMDCKFVYAVIPKSGKFSALAEDIAKRKSKITEARAKARATRLVQAVDNTMTLEGQGTNRAKERIEEETQRLLKRKP